MGIWSPSVALKESIGTRREPLTICSDEATIKQATEAEEIQVVQTGKPPRIGSWSSLCREFFEEALAQVPEDSRSDITVVLTGGASNMGFVKSICKDVFGSAKVLAVNRPSFTVAEGLCYAARKDLKALKVYYGTKTGGSETNLPDEVSAMLKKNSEVLGNRCADAMIDDVMGKLICHAESWAEKSDCKKTILELMDAFEPDLQKILNSDCCRKVVEEEIKQWCTGATAGIVNIVNQRFEKIYQNTLNPNAVEFQLSGKQNEKILRIIGKSNDANVASIVGIIQKSIKDNLVFTILGSTVSVVMYTGTILVGLIEWMIPGTDGSVFAASDKASSFVWNASQKNPELNKPLGNFDRRTILKKLKQEKKRNEVKDAIAQVMAKIVNVDQVGEKLLADVLSEAIDRISLYYIAGA